MDNINILRFCGEGLPLRELLTMRNNRCTVQRHKAFLLRRDAADALCSNIVNNPSAKYNRTMYNTEKKP